MQQIQQLEMQKHTMEMQNNHEQSSDSMNQNNIQNNFQNSFSDQSFNSMNYDQNFNATTQQLYGSESGDNYASNNSLSGNENSYDSQIFDQMKNQNNTEKEEVDLSHLPNINFSQPPPGFQPEPPVLLGFGNGLPDLTKPPPGFPPLPEINNDELMPSVPYFELPAGLMVPLIMVRRLLVVVLCTLILWSHLLKTLYLLFSKYDLLFLKIGNKHCMAIGSLN